MEAIAVYIKEYRSLKNALIPLSPCFDVELKKDKIIVQKKQSFNVFRYFHSNILNLTAIIGSNGCGKTSILNVMADVFAYKQSTNGNVILFYDDNEDKVCALGQSTIQIFYQECECSRFNAVEDSFPVGMLFVSNAFNPSAYNYPYRDNKPGNGFFNYEIAKLIKDAAMKYKPPLVDVVRPYIVEETKREIEFIKKHGKIADFDIRNCIIGTAHNSIQEAIAVEIEATKAKECTKENVFMNKFELGVTNSREIYFWSQFVLNSVSSFWDKYHDKKYEKDAFEKWLSRYWNVAYECCDKNVDAHHKLVKLAEVMGSFFSENFNFNVYDTVQDVMMLLYDKLTFTDSGCYVANNAEQVQEVLDIYKKCVLLLVKGIDCLDFSWNMSSGEQALLSLFARLASISDHDLSNYHSLLICIDEADLFFHPEWQQEFVYKLQEKLPKIYAGKKIQIIITSHSPIFLSDIPRNHIVLLKKSEKLSGQSEIVLGKYGDIHETFAANIFSLYNDTFFLHKHNNIGIIGDYANNVIKYVLRLIAMKEICIKISDFSSKKILYKNDEKNDLKKQCFVQELLQSISNFKTIFADVGDVYSEFQFTDYLFENLDGQRDADVEVKIMAISRGIDKHLKTALDNLVPLIGEEFLRKQIRGKIDALMSYPYEGRQDKIKRLFSEYNVLSELEKIAFKKLLGDKNVTNNNT